MSEEMGNPWLLLSCVVDSDGTENESLTRTANPTPEPVSTRRLREKEGVWYGERRQRFIGTASWVGRSQKCLLP